jgi:quinol monooxygenase YgiN
MPIFQTADFQVKPEALGVCERAIREFVEYVAEMEQGSTLRYTSLRRPDDPTRFMHFFIFADAAAREVHRGSTGVIQFTDVLYPNLIGDVEFTEYEMFAST